MGLINTTKNAATPGGPDPELAALATLLRDSLREKVEPGIKCRIATWANDLRVCRTVECGGDAARLARVVRWYCADPKRKGLPDQIRSASGFRKAFLWIEGQYKKGEKDKPPDTISPDAAAAAERASVIGFRYPAFRALTPAHAQTCIDRYTPVRAKLWEFVTRRKEELAGKDRVSSTESGLVLACEMVMRTCMPPPATFAQRYLEDVLKQMHGWPDFRGEFSYFLFAPAQENGFLLRKIGTALGGYAGAGAGLLIHRVKEVMGL